LVYTITSRAMYKLDIIYTGEKSPLLDADKSTYEEK
jgi:DNA helicase-2/ATP-dependent DNA helicase PcrA